ncbi:hypothetical protein [Fusibacter sp. 3D3]|uniref:IS66 family insertion sequence element accessory protein TnpA n=1 Tax=Fusibacter sp. 3D3 TaxID=1048380 RepID=UPI0008534B49|nr:hypothetical protein [Fusibacter sp. 3D3]GAU79321.1 hypothetical protein F3D3_3980 [Fusibacter sp. 3D3]
MNQDIKEATADVRRDKWISIIAAQNASGLSIKAWCQENGVNEASYYYWLKKCVHIILIQSTLPIKALH